MFFDVVCCTASNRVSRRRMVVGEINLKIIERKEMSLIATIEELDPGHFARREDILEHLRGKARALGFFPLPLTRNDVECFWIRLEPNESYGKNFRVHMSEESYFDAVELESVMDIFKRAAKYDGAK